MPKQLLAYIVRFRRSIAAFCAGLAIVLIVVNLRPNSATQCTTKAIMDVQHDVGVHP